MCLGLEWPVVAPRDTLRAADQPSSLLPDSLFVDYENYLLTKAPPNYLAIIKVSRSLCDLLTVLHGAPCSLSPGFIKGDVCSRLPTSANDVP